MYSDFAFGGQLDDLDMDLEVPFVPTDERVVEAMLELGGVDADDVLYDLGSGDGRIVVAAARDHGARAVGVEIDPVRVSLAGAYAAQMGVEHMACFIEADLFDADFAPATVVTLYLLNSVNLGLRPRLLNELQPGARIVSHAFDMGDWRPDRKMTSRDTSIYLWIVPAKVAGDWHWQTADGQHYRVVLEQKYQKLQGSAWVGGEPAKLRTATLWGDLLELIIEPEGAERPVSIVMHCRDDCLVVVDGPQKGVVAHLQ